MIFIFRPAEHEYVHGFVDLVEIYVAINCWNSEDREYEFINEIYSGIVEFCLKNKTLYERVP